jgi:hypothetical protein
MKGNGTRTKESRHEGSKEEISTYPFSSLSLHEHMSRLDFAEQLLLFKLQSEKMRKDNYVLRALGYLAISCFTLNANI